MSVLSTAQLDAMRATITGLLPDTVTNETTSVTTTCWLEADTREHSLPGAPSEVRQRRWRIEQPSGTLVSRGDLLDVTGMGKYWVVEVLNPQSNSVQVISLCYLVVDAGGGTVPGVLPNATVKCFRQHVQIGDTYRVRILRAPPGAVTPYGEAVPDQMFDVPDAPAGWRQGDIMEIVQEDYFTVAAAPSRFRVLVCDHISDPPPYTRVQLLGHDL